MNGFPSSEVTGIMNTNSYIQGKSRKFLFLYHTAGPSGCAWAQPFHSEQLTCPGSETEHPACKPAASGAADTICLPCLYKSCSS